jgi:hypothetical protein
MRRILQFGILAALGAIFSVASAQASVLWWETNDPEGIEVSVTDEQGQPTGETTTAAALGVTDVRIRVSGGEAGDNTYLQMAYFDPATGGLTIGNTPGTTVVEVPTYDVYAYLGPDGYNYDNAAYSFTIELGNWANGTWTVLAESETATYAALAGHIAPGGGGLDVPYALPWMPSEWHQYYVVPVPEPGTTLLIVIGCAVLALRRRPTI